MSLATYNLKYEDMKNKKTRKTMPKVELKDKHYSINQMSTDDILLHLLNKHKFTLISVLAGIELIIILMEVIKWNT